MQRSFLRSLPVGFVLFLLTYFMMRRRRTERSKSLLDLPAFAAAESLEYRERSPGRAGVVTGQYRGFDLRVDPDEGAKILLRFAHSPKVELRTFRFLKRQPPGMEPLLTSYRDFDGYFLDRYVSRAINDALSDQTEVDLDEFVAELKASPQRILTLSISAEGIECRLTVDRVAYISKQTLEYLLPRFARLGKVLDVTVAENSASEVENDPEHDDV